VIALLYCLWGLAGNYLQLWAINNLRFQLVSIIEYLSIAVAAIILFGIIISIVKYNHSLRDWGFTLDRGFIISLGLSSFAIILAYFQNTSGLYVHTRFLPHHIIYASNEELIFRVLLIGAVIRKFGISKETVLTAIIISAILFTIMHIPTVDVINLIQLFITSIIMGYIFYLTGSALFLLVAHVMANTSQVSGFMGVFIIIAAYFILAVIGEVIERKRSLKGSIGVN